jgi:23S rRNA pseudouridine2605 synthase
MRINRYLAAAGFGSRRACEALIRRGAVSVNGAVVETLAATVDTEADAVAVDGHAVPAAAPTRVLVLNKPTGVLSTVADAHNRKTVMDIAREHGFAQRLFPVGRLDLDTSGILILTNDGGLSYRLTHPRFKIEKTYRVAVKGEIGEEAVAAIVSGVDLDGYRTKPCRVEVLERSGGATVLRVHLREGRKRQIRRMFALHGHPVTTLERTALGDLTFDDLAPGRMRALTVREERRLRELAGLQQEGEDRSSCH